MQARPHRLDRRFGLLVLLQSGDGQLADRLLAGVPVLFRLFDGGDNGR